MRPTLLTIRSRSLATIVAAAAGGGDEDDEQQQLEVDDAAYDPIKRAARAMELERAKKRGPPCKAIAA